LLFCTEHECVPDHNPRSVQGLSQSFDPASGTPRAIHGVPFGVCVLAIHSVMGLVIAPELYITTQSLTSLTENPHPPTTMNPINQESSLHGKAWHSRRFPNLCLHSLRFRDKPIVQRPWVHKSGASRPLRRRSIFPRRFAGSCRRHILVTHH